MENSIGSFTRNVLPQSVPLILPIRMLGWVGFHFLPDDVA